MAFDRFLQKLLSRGQAQATQAMTGEIKVDEAAARLLRVVANAAGEAATRVEAQVERRQSRQAGVVTIADARARPIVFRDIYPPPRRPGLSFYGGVPVGPAAMAWPRHPSRGFPLTFLLQVEGAALAAVDLTGLLPRDGVLYLFSSLEWGEDMLFRFVHEAGATEGWGSLAVPADLPPAWGSEQALQFPYVALDMPAAERDLPRLQPRWPFTPVALDYPAAAASEEEETNDPRFWAETAAVKDALIRAQDPAASLVASPDRKTPPFERPFASFPQDWAAVRVVAATAMRGRVQDYQWKRLAPDLDAAGRAAIVAGWKEEARALYREATRHSPGEAIAQPEADALWARIEPLRELLKPWESVTHQAVNASLGLNSAGVATIPAALIEDNAQYHSLGRAFLREEYQHEFAKRVEAGAAVERASAVWRASRSDADMAAMQAANSALDAAYEDARVAGTLRQVRDSFVRTPNRMLGPPSYVQGDCEGKVGDHVLLLEITSNDSIGMGMGDGVLQFMIRPDDLAARRFDRVWSIGSSY